MDLRHAKPALRRRCHGSVVTTQFVIALLAVALFPFAALADHDEQCFQRTAARYAVPVDLLRAIRSVEGGREGVWRANTNHSYDYGVMQINSVWLSRLRPLGYDAYVLTHDRCASIEVAGWILAQAFAEERSDVAGDPHRYWRAVGRYHSATTALNRQYAERVWRQMQRSANASRQSVGGHHGR